MTKRCFSRVDHDPGFSHPGSIRPRRRPGGPASPDSCNLGMRFPICKIGASRVGSSHDPPLAHTHRPPFDSAQGPAEAKPMAGRRPHRRSETTAGDPQGGRVSWRATRMAIGLGRPMEQHIVGRPEAAPPLGAGFQRCRAAPLAPRGFTGAAAQAAPVQQKPADAVRKTDKIRQDTPRPKAVAPGTATRMGADPRRRNTGTPS